MKKSQLRKSLIAVSALSVSIASQLGAATYDSNGLGGGPWSAPASWTYIAGLPVGTVPDTFIGDVATILASDTIDYDGGNTTPLTRAALDPSLAPLALGAGSLAVSNGGSLTVDGGTFTQSVLNNEIRIGDGGGGFLGNTGVGTLTIRNAGIFVTGDGTAAGGAIGLVVGGNMDVGGSGGGTGTVNIEDGNLIMGGGVGGVFGSAAMGVGIEGSTGFLNVGDGIGAADTAILNLLTNNNTLAIGSNNGLPAGSTAGTGTAVVAADGAILMGSGTIYVGNSRSSLTDFGSGTLTINGGELGQGASSSGEIRIGSDGGVGTFNVNAGTALDPLTVLTVGELNIGRGVGADVGLTPSVGTATINILATDAFSVGSMSVGREGGNGTLNVNGVSVAAVTEFRVGRDAGSIGAATIAAGSTLNASGISGIGSGGTGTLNVNGTFATTNLGVGQGGGTGTVNVTGLVTVNPGGGQSYAGDGAGSTGTVNVTGPGVINNVSGQDWQIGFNGGTGNLNVVSGGKVNFNWWLNIARGGSSVGNVLVDGAGSEIKLSGGGDINLNVGEDGQGTMTVSNGARVTHNDAQSYRSHVGRNGGSVGVLNVTTGGRVDVTELFAGSSGGANGEINIESGGIVTTQNWLAVGTGGGSVGVINIDGAGSLLDTRSPLFGRNGGWGGDSQVGLAGGNGTVNVTNGGTWQNGWWVNIARDSGSTGVVNVDGAGSRLLIGQTVGLGGPDARLNVGEHGTGTLNITNGGLVLGNTETAVGQNGGSVGVLNVNTGGTFTTGNWLIIGNAGGSTGTVNLDDAGSSINLTGEYDGGGNLQERSRLFIGRSGTGTLNQTGGTITFSGWSAIGLDRGSVGTYNMSGGTMQNRQQEFDFDWFVGRQNSDGATTFASGTLNVSGTANFDMQTDTGNTDPGGRNGMRLNVGSGHDGTTFDSQGTVNVSGGTLSVLSFTVGDNGQGTVTQDGGTVNVGQWMEIGQGNAPDGPQNLASYTLNGGVLNVQQLVIGTRRAGTMTVNGGIINLGNNGTVQVNGWGDFAVGRDGGGADHGNGVLNVTGGTINANGKHLQIARGGPNTQGVLNMTGGDINGLSLMTLGEGGATTAIANLSGGTITTNNEVRVGQGAGTVGSLNVSGTAVLTSGGELQVGNDGGTGTANISGGTVIALNRVAIGRGVGGFQINNYANADAVIDGGPELEYSFPANYTTSNTQDNGDGGGPFGLGVQLQGLPAGDNNDFAFVGLGNFTVDTTGSYTFGNNTDDGSRLRLSINGGAFTEIITDNVLSGPHDAFSAPIVLTMGDTIALDWMWFERGGGAEGETFYSRDGGPNALWEDSSQGLTLTGGQYSGTVYKAEFTTSNGTVNLTGGVLSTTFVEAGVGNATLSFGGGTLGLLQNESDLIRGFTNSGGHSGIILTAAGGTIDTAGFDGRIQQSNVFVDTDASSVDGLAGTVLNKAGLGTLTLESAVDTNGTVSVHVLAGTLDFEASQTLDALVIDGGATVTMSALSSPPAPPAPAGLFEAGELFDGGAGGSDALLAGSVQGVPEPGTIGLLLVSALGLLGRPARRKRS